jgi:hypothetical protein
VIDAQLDLSSIRARPGSRLSDKEAKQVAPELFDLERKHGMVTPEAILAKARDPESPLHQFFEWDDAKAAETQRLNTARLLAKAVAYRVILGGKDISHYQPALIRVRDKDDTGIIRSGYVSIERAVERADLREQIIENARKEMEAMIRKFRTIEALANVVPYLEQAHQQLSGAQAR